MLAEDINVVTASSGQAALEELDAGMVPSIVVLDLHLPNVDGWAVWDRLRSDERFKAVAVVVWTGIGLRQGAVGDALIVEKTDPTALLAAVKTLWAKQRALQAS